MEIETVSLATLSNGSAIERFDLALAEVIANIQDINTSAKKDRSITLKLTIKPNEERKMGKVSVDISTKLAPLAPFGADLFLALDNHGKGVAVEANANQTKLFPEQHTSKIAAINGGDK